MKIKMYFIWAIVLFVCNRTSVNKCFTKRNVKKKLNKNQSIYVQDERGEWKIKKNKM